LVERKGHDMVLRALPQILEKVPNLIYLIVGDGQNKKNLLKLRSRLKLDQNVIFTGYLSDNELPALYQASSALIMPARQGPEGDIEGFGLVFLEANSHGLPVIAGNTGGQTEAVVDGSTGLIVDSLSTSQIAQAVIKLITDQKLARRLGEQGKKRVQEEFNWDNETRKIEKLLK